MDESGEYPWQDRRQRYTESKIPRAAAKEHNVHPSLSLDYLWKHEQGTVKNGTDQSVRVQHLLVSLHDDLGAKQPKSELCQQGCKGGTVIRQV